MSRIPKIKMEMMVLSSASATGAKRTTKVYIKEAMRYKGNTHVSRPAQYLTGHPQNA